MRQLLSLAALLVISAGSALGQVSVQLPDISGQPGETDVFAIDVGDLSDYEIKGVQFRIEFDPDVIDLTGVQTDGTIADEFTVANTNTDFEGDIRFAAGSGSPIDTDADDFIFIEVEYLDFGETTLEFERFRLNEGELPEVDLEDSEGSAQVVMGPVDVQLPTELVGMQGETFDLPVITDEPDMPVDSYEFTISYDAELLEINEVTLDGSLSEEAGFDVQVDTDAEGAITVEASSDDGFQEQGNLIYLHMELLQPGVSDLTWDHLAYNDDPDLVNPIDGSFEIMESEDIDFANLQAPPGMDLTSGESETVYGRVYIPGATEGDGQVNNLSAWVGVHDADTDPAEWEEEAWTEMQFNAAGSDEDWDEYSAELEETLPGDYYYATRFSTDGIEYYYGGYSDQSHELGGDTGGGFWDGDDNVSGELSVSAVEVGDIAELYEEGDLASDIVYELTGEVYLAFQQDFRNKKILVDPTGGIGIDDAPEGSFDPGIITTGYDRYDGITGLTGRLSEFEGYTEFSPVEDPGEATSSENRIYPERITPDELGQQKMSRLVMLEEVEFTESGVFEEETDYEITGPGGQTATFYTDFFDADYMEEDIPEDPVNLVGYAGVSGDEAFVTAREQADFLDPELISGFDLTFPADGETVVVEGGENEELAITWESADSEADLTYRWIAQESGLLYKPALLDREVDESGAESQLSFTLGELDELLEDFGLGEGDQITLDWTAVAASVDGAGYRFANQDWTATLERGTVTSSPEETQVPDEVTLDQNYPNPFNPVTSISYQIPSDSHVQLEVYNSLGQHVETLVDGRVQSGTHEVSFNGEDLSSGVYLYRLEVGDQVRTHHMTLIK